MPATHTNITSFLERAQRAYQDEVAAAMARYRAAEMSAQRQCGAEPGHIFAALQSPAPAGSPESGRPPLVCVVCRVPRWAVDKSLPNNPPQSTREITA